MSAGCQQALDNVGLGVSASLQAVDCVANQFAAQAFGRLFASGGGLGTALTILLTLFIAFFAIQLLLGRSSLSVRSLTPRMMTLGLVVTFATSWVAFHSVVWNLAVQAPDYLASMVTGDRGSATQTFGDKIDIVFAAVQTASGGQTDISAFSPAGLLWLGAMLLLLGTVGVLVTARIALAVLVALGPVFVVMALFEGTRGLFAGWLKGVVMLALTPLFAVLGGGVMLELAVPVLSALAQPPGQINPQAAAAFFLIGAVHVALMVLVLRTAATMVSGWTVFGLARQSVPSAAAPGSLVAPAPAPAALPPAAQLAATTSATIAASRRLDVSAIPVAAAANDTSGAASGGFATRRDVRIHTATPAGGAATPAIAPLRAQGIGSRFKPANIRNLEKIR
ncbi:type IV secretion system protein [Erythrobacteraceae bacterium CFH 75059]|uniref:type IV secretion system protein n=1 Tax=Qipengyuania thermophila TaxID=2509361 RepID=UPI00101F629A|nr:type IV secretion system protein [Qipengyuania thermophila]TCD01884.1 type IV secretion system protein [Erythrobacteraceae bacterium CFH 75059]